MRRCKREGQAWPRLARHERATLRSQGFDALAAAHVLRHGEAAQRLPAAHREALRGIVSSRVMKHLREPVPLPPWGALCVQWWPSREKVWHGEVVTVAVEKGLVIE